MRTTIIIDDDIMESIMRLSRGATRSQAIRTALKEYIKHQKKEQVLALRGKVDLTDNWQQLRELEKPE